MITSYCEKRLVITILVTPIITMLQITNTQVWHHPTCEGYLLGSSDPLPLCIALASLRHSRSNCCSVSVISVDKRLNQTCQHTEMNLSWPTHKLSLMILQLNNRHVISWSRQDIFSRILYSFSLQNCILTNYKHTSNTGTIIRNIKVCIN